MTTALGAEMEDKEVAFVDDLVSAFPELQDDYETHVYNNDGVLAHLFLWDVTQRVVESFRNQDDDAPDWRAVLSFLEDRFLEEQTAGKDSVVDSLITTAFLWNLPFPGSPGHEISSHLGPTLTRRFQEMRSLG
ncbi:hypothetical protein ACFVWZ_06490 [Streptomyces sp. NPDC058200]|uniref:hypothetical protein n=1 Tax=Streptomyces sp. NPDC058200 TaxID=3346378 RepID=UPI0036EC3C8C